MSEFVFYAIGFVLIGFSIPSWLYKFKIFDIFYKGISGNDPDAVIIRIAIALLGLLLVYFGFRRTGMKRYITISKKEGMNIQVSKKVVLDVVKDIVQKFSDKMNLKTVRLGEETNESNELDVGLIVELKDTKNINELIENLIGTIKDELNNRIGISNVRITVGVERLAIHG